MTPILAAVDNRVVLQGVILMLTGMASVYLFLTILIFVMKGAAKVVPKLAFMLPDPEPAKPKAPAPKKDAGAEVALAIAAAVKRARG